jgi:hypothetical protein
MVKPTVVQHNAKRQLPGAIRFTFEPSSPPGQLHALLGGGLRKQRNRRPAQRRRATHRPQRFALPAGGRDEAMPF